MVHLYSAFSHSNNAHQALYNDQFTPSRIWKSYTVTVSYITVTKSIRHLYLIIFSLSVLFRPFLSVSQPAGPVLSFFLSFRSVPPSLLPPSFLPLSLSLPPSFLPSLPPSSLPSFLPSFLYVYNISLPVIRTHSSLCLAFHAFSLHDLLQ